MSKHQYTVAWHHAGMGNNRAIVLKFAVGFWTAGGILTNKIAVGAVKQLKIEAVEI